jgi:uncharacterized protein (DUF58 family)
MEIRDLESGKVTSAFGFSSKFRRDYEDFWLTDRIFWERECRRRGIDSLVVDTEDDPAKALLSFFKRRKGR